MPPILEKLEPRILLSGDGLLYAAAPDPLENALPDSSSQTVQYAELLESDPDLLMRLDDSTAGEEVESSSQEEPIAAIYTLNLDAQVPLAEDSSEGVIVDTQLSESDENPQEKSSSDVGIALILGVDLLDNNEVEPNGEDVDSECIEGCQRQLIIEQLTDTLRIPHGPPDADGVLTSMDDLQLQYVDAGGQIDLVIRLNTQNSTVIEVFDNNEGGLLASYSLSEINSLVIIGGDNSDDTLTVDFSNPFSVPGGIVFAGGDAGYDRLILIGSSDSTAEYFGDGDGCACQASIGPL